MSSERGMDPREDPERRAALAREAERLGQQRLPFSESARPSGRLRNMVPHVHKKLKKDADIVVDRLETAFGSPRKVEMYDNMDGHAIKLTWNRMGFGSDKTYIVTVVLDDGGL